MRLEPLLDCVVIEQITMVGKLHLPDTANGGGLRRGVIVAAGDGVRKLKVGDEVFYAVRARGATAELVHFEGKDFVVCPAEAVVARVRPDELERVVETHDAQTCPSCIADGSAEAERRVADEAGGAWVCNLGTVHPLGKLCACVTMVPDGEPAVGPVMSEEWPRCAVCSKLIYAGDLVSNVGTLAHSKCRPDFIEREFKP
jgi:co-chaperonin GroES (HSP10)